MMYCCDHAHAVVRGGGKRSTYILRQGSYQTQTVALLYCVRIATQATTFFYLVLSVQGTRRCALLLEESYEGHYHHEALNLPSRRATKCFVYDEHVRLVVNGPAKAAPV